jgi:hypothetical protein
MKLQILAKAIRTLNPNAQFSVETINENDFNITWHNNTQAIAKQTIINKQTELQAEYDSKEYQRDRANEYPDFKEYLDGIVKGDQAQIDKYIADCLAVKAKYPKE